MDLFSLFVQCSSVLFDPHDCLSNPIYIPLTNNSGHYLISIFNFIMSPPRLLEKDVLFKHFNAFIISLIIS